MLSRSEYVMMEGQNINIKPTKNYTIIKVIIVLLILITIGGIIFFFVIPKEKELTMDERHSIYLRDKTYQHHDAMVGSGYNDMYYFSKDNKYYYFTSQMDGKTRLKGAKGTWSIKNGKLILTATKQVTAINGEFVDSVGSYATAKTLINYDLEVKTINDVKKYNYEIYDVGDSDKDVVYFTINYKTLTLNGDDKWYLGGYDYNSLSTDDYKLYIELLNGNDIIVSHNDIAD
jgi:hypothetical protein